MVNFFVEPITKAGWHPYTEVGYFHMFQDGVDTVMIDHCCYHHVAGDIYAGEREDHFFRFSLLCQAAIEVCEGGVQADWSMLYN